jgi:LuxR family maltose regulon positive regulatory protein
MVTPLLRTKLHIPPARPELVPRPRLIDRLRAALSDKLTLISAPAGFGKTTLLSEGVRAGQRPVAWISLDENDNDPVRFLSYLAAALQTIDLGNEDPFPPPRSDALEPAMTALINRVSTAPTPFILVLDDYHVIKAPTVHSVTSFLLDHMPAQMHLVIATRADPPLPLARLRGRGQLTELRQSDLRFSNEETAAFLRQATGMDISGDNIEALVDRTEGWIAGLQMAAMSMAGQDEVDSFIAAFTGSHEYIVDYLTDEVLARQTEDVQTFLLQTSVLDRLSGPLCDAVTGQTGSQQMLERLQRTNMFIISLDRERRWYRHHHLFADLLKKRLHQTRPGRVADLHRRASEWYEESARALGRPPNVDSAFLGNAIQHALAADDAERALKLIEQAAEATLMRSEVATFLSWMERLPDALVRSRPTLCLFYAWALLLSNRPLGEVESLLRDVRTADEAAIRTFIATFQGQEASASILSDQVLQELPESDHLVRNLIACSESLSISMQGDVHVATHTLEEVARMAQDAGNKMVAVLTLCQLAEQHIIAGQLQRARAIYEQAASLATDERGRPLPVAGIAHIGLGTVLYEWNELDDAARHSQKGIDLGGEWAEIGVIDGYIVLAHIEQARGDAARATQLMQEAQRLAARSAYTDLDDVVVATHHVRLAIAQGDSETTSRWIEERSLEQNPPPNYHFYELEYLTLARVHLALGAAHEAACILEGLLAEAEQLHRTGKSIEILALQAMAHRARDEMAQALPALERALTLAEPEGYVRTFLDEGTPLTALLRKTAAKGVAASYASRLLAATRDTQVDSASTTQLVEPLSEREIEVLRLIASGLSNQEIADALVIALGTVKAHSSSIYGKLGVRNRAQAVTRAQELNLL